MGSRGKKAIILEKLICIHLKDLRKLSLFNKTDGYKSVPVKIERSNGLTNHSCSMMISVSTQPGNCYVKFDCDIDDQPVSYTVPLVQAFNHLTKQTTFYFFCKVANKKCRKLYLHHQKFVCRDAVENGYYLRDTLSRSRRVDFESVKRLHKIETDLATCGRKWFQRTRYGKPTIKMNRVTIAKMHLNHLNRDFQ